MSSFSTVAPFYTSDLEAMTALVLNRSSFLDSVTDAVTHEGKNSDATKMVSVLEKNAFLSLMPAFLTDADINIRKKAYLALGNLIASDNRAVAEVAFKCAYNALVDDKFVFTAETAPGISYVLANLAMRIAKWSNVKDILGNALYIKAPIALYVKEHLTTELSASVKHDLLWVFKHLERPCWKTSAKLDPLLLISILEEEQKKTFKLALHLLGDQVADDQFFESHCFEETYDYLSYTLQKDKVPFDTTVEHLWMLSNLVTESGMGLLFLQDEDLFDAIATLIRLDDSVATTVEAVFVIMNSLHHVNLHDLAQFRLFEVRDLLSGFVKDNIGRANFRAEVETMLTKVDAEIRARFPPSTPVVEPEEEDDTVYEEYGADMEIDYDSAWYPTASERAETIFSEAQPPCEIPAFSIFNPPSAVDLLRKKIIFEFTSATVFNLIQSLEANNLQFTPIPDGTTLTVEDLKALETRGYVIVRGAIGINPTITLALYGSA
jgi:hypothetical protein